MRAAVLLLAGLALLSFVTGAEAATARLRTETSATRIDVHPGQEVGVVVRVVGSIECSLPGAPEGAKIELNKASRVEGQEPDLRLIWAATPSEKTFSWHEAGLMRYAIDESFTLLIHSPRSAANVPRDDLTEVLRWQSAKQVSSGTTCNRSFDWTIESPSIDLRVINTASAPGAARSLPGEESIGEPLALQGVSTVPTEAKVVAGLAIALVVTGGAMVLIAVQRARSR